MTLHTLNRPLSSQALVDDCLAALSANDSLLLLEDGVYCALDSQLERFPLPEGVALYVLAADVEARGLADRIRPEARSINDADFVHLCCEHDKVLSWF